MKNFNDVLEKAVALYTFRKNKKNYDDDFDIIVNNLLIVNINFRYKRSDKNINLRLVSLNIDHNAKTINYVFSPLALLAPIYKTQPSAIKDIFSIIKNLDFSSKRKLFNNYNIKISKKILTDYDKFFNNRYPRDIDTYADYETVLDIETPNGKYNIIGKGNFVNYEYDNKHNWRTKQPIKILQIKFNCHDNCFKDEEEFDELILDLSEEMNSAIIKYYRKYLNNKDVKNIISNIKSNSPISEYIKDTIPANLFNIIDNVDYNKFHEYKIKLGG